MYFFVITLVEKTHSTTGDHRS